MEKVNVEKLVEDIKSGEKAYREGKWHSWCEPRGLGKKWFDRWYPADYSTHMTGLYTLRAHLRGRTHRKNPPAPIRDFNRSVRDDGSNRRIAWDEAAHNRKIAEEFSEAYKLEEAA
jgi:hypothetical protein